MTVKGASDKVAAAELADKEQTILELQETNEVKLGFCDDIAALSDWLMMCVTSRWSIYQLSAKFCSAVHLDVTNGMLAC